ncbi:hypothetical protein CLOLEP_00194 [[Clostridium] leptum DSM 753]|uniref:Uncharacterized protein n=1 Tax=[Clostridium] leptum DSM 753 TaxID=428125 RepID=A7VNR8_9FIRM|nr:hypothetical protein CLOLEP_00194 [[Clostridium] leptum DSM 753]
MEALPRAALSCAPDLGIRPAVRFGGLSKRFRSAGLERAVWNLESRRTICFHKPIFNV